jgi:DNA invertase Pin-like site-specific DNA recombinase
MNIPNAHDRTPIRVAEYVRMSSELQKYSTQNQSSAIATYAASHSMAIVRSYRDEGKSGLRLAGRPALQQLLDDVRSGGCGFELVLVLDVSRWGRFQNTDEAAYHEFVCHLAGVRVIYVAEPFSDDATPFSAVLKGLKRAMAGEYSRELSAKVYAGQARLIGLGYRQGGRAGYGLRRMRLDGNGVPQGLLDPGQLKAVTTDRVILVPGPPAEVRVVRDIFRDFIAGKTMPAIARKLNERGILNAEGNPWKNHHIRSLLRNPKYVGENVYGRTHGTLRQRRIRAPENTWVRRKASFEAIVPRHIFTAANERFLAMAKKASDKDVLAPLRRILKREGHISTRLIQAEDGALSIPALVRRFGGLRQIYALIGFVPNKSLIYADARFHLRDVRERTTRAVVDLLEGAGFGAVRDGWRVTIEGAWSVSVTVLNASMYQKFERWYPRQKSEKTDVVVFVRMSLAGTTLHDYVFWPLAVYRFLPKDVSARWFADIGAYTNEALVALASCVASQPSEWSSSTPTPDDRANTLHELGEKCRHTGSTISRALAAIDRWPGASEIPWGGSSDACVPVRVSVAMRVLRYVTLARQARAHLRNADLVCWLARHDPQALETLQQGADSLSPCE